MILQLKRELEQAQSMSPRQEAISLSKSEPKRKVAISKNTDTSVYLYSPSLITTDLKRTLILALLVFGLEFMLYLKLK